MKKILFGSFLIIFLFLVFFSGYNNNPRIIISRLINTRDIQELTELRYIVYFLGIIPVGEAVFHPARINEFMGKDAYHLRATAETSRFFSRFFSAGTSLDSFVDVHQLNPLLYRLKLTVSGRKDINEEIIYNQKDGFMSVSGVKRLILPNTQDPLSSMFNIMRMDFEKIKEFQMNINAHKKNYILKGMVQNKDLSINNKLHKTYILKGKVFRQDNNPYHQSSFTIVLLKQNCNIPLLIKVFSGGVLIQVKLVDIR